MCTFACVCVSGEKGVEATQQDTHAAHLRGLGLGGKVLCKSSYSWIA